MDRPPIIKLTDFGIAKSIEGKIVNIISQHRSKLNYSFEQQSRKLNYDIYFQISNNTREKFREILTTEYLYAVFGRFTIRQITDLHITL